MLLRRALANGRPRAAAAAAAAISVPSFGGSCDEALAAALAAGVGRPRAVHREASRGLVTRSTIGGGGGCHGCRQQRRGWQPAGVAVPGVPQRRQLHSCRCRRGGGGGGTSAEVETPLLGVGSLDVIPRTPTPLPLGRAPAGARDDGDAELLEAVRQLPPLDAWGDSELLMSGCERGAAPLRVAMLLSGGVDSSVALRLLVSAGHKVTAFYLQIWFQEDFRNFWDACPWEEDLGYARKVCESMGVELQMVPMTNEYWDRVVSASVKEIRDGRTPNPDMLCNSRVKFGAFYDYLGQHHAGAFERIASGHYARVLRPETDTNGNRSSKSSGASGTSSNASGASGGSSNLGGGASRKTGANDSTTGCAAQPRTDADMSALPHHDHAARPDGGTDSSMGSSASTSTSTSTSTSMGNSMGKSMGSSTSSSSSIGGSIRSDVGRVGGIGGVGAAPSARLAMTPDAIKDQTYFLAHLSPSQLSRCMFPLGGLKKATVRALAAAAGLANKDRKDSQGICFLGKVKFHEFVKEHLGEWPGLLVEEETGSTIGLHQGYWFYTVGQRSGIKLPGGPWYVVRKDRDLNVVYASKQYYEPGKSRREFAAGCINWVSHARPDMGRPVHVKVRHGPAIYECASFALQSAGSAGGDTATVMLHEDDQGLAAGQYAVFYQDGVCLGAGKIQ